MKLIKKLIIPFALLLSLHAHAAIPTIAESAETIAPLLNGEAVPNVTLNDVDGTPVALAELVKTKPTIVFFYRGGWCPFCTMQMSQLQTIEADLQAMGYQLIGISPDKPVDLKASIADKKLSYTLLSDRNLDATTAFGLGFFLSDKVATMYRNNIQTEFVTRGDEKRIVLPVPAAYVFNTQGIVQFQYVNPNYKARVEPEVLKLAAKLALTK
ncbi:peroxiredoxin-like family protein [Echinimonas agarilytica]|uniref:thioredoxin-dependent peroxiredoxin n=1 Tax=Echinimonas agarilytica TaxID=1215918 RepID=A0AA41W5H6_9GAMM|nr:peroxiredoxin-like family protein [Echinimonas agarilytica]MCM2679010.1 AhpC/TSA family protein [Echinimonas agarilytica]